MIKRPPWWFGPTLIVLALGVWLVARGASQRGSASTADWVAAISTLGAFLGAAYASWYVARAYDVELKREQDRDRDTRTAQASLIAAWFDSRTHNPFDHGPVTVTTDGVLIRNASNLPVYGVTMIVTIGSYHVGELGADLVPPSPEPMWVPFTNDMDQLLADLRGDPGMDDLGNQIDRPTGAPDPAVRKNARPQVEISFYDSSGNFWTRPPTGELRM